MKLATLCYVVDTDQNKTLMLHRVKKENDYHAGKWNGLGGKFNQGESPEDCVIREVKEESGLEIINPQLRGFITFPFFDEIEDWYVFVFTVNDFKGNLINSKEGNLEWISNKELLKLNLWDGDKIFLNWFYDENGTKNSTKFFSAKFEYEKGRFKDYSVSFY